MAKLLAQQCPSATASERGKRQQPFPHVSTNSINGDKTRSDSGAGSIMVLFASCSENEFATSPNAFDLSLNVHYKITQSISTLRSRNPNVDSDQTSRSYARNRYSLELTVTF